MNISLTPELERIIQAQVASGFYNNASEVIREALRLLIKENSLDKAYDHWIKSEVDKGITEADRGEFVEASLKDVKSRALKKK